jgi:hypothetical protein
MAGPDHIVTGESRTTGAGQVLVEKEDVSQVERVLSGGSEIHKDFIDYDRMDKDVAKYANQEPIQISEAENKRLKRMIDRRVLAIMIPTYFLQALDKGTLSFAAIMGMTTRIWCIAPDG